VEEKKKRRRRKEAARCMLEEPISICGSGARPKEEARDSLGGS
jgi:hypothetical protein